MFYYISMNDKEFLDITTSIEEKLGDNSAIIADDLGRAITGFEAMKKDIKDKAAEIERLKKDKEKLVLANGNLLKQIPVTSDDDFEQASDESKQSYENYNFKNAFDEKGNFKIK